MKNSKILSALLYPHFANPSSVSYQKTWLGLVENDIRNKGYLSSLATLLYIVVGEAIPWLESWTIYVEKGIGAASSYLLLSSDWCHVASCFKFPSLELLIPSSFKFLLIKVKKKGGKRINSHQPSGSNYIIIIVYGQIIMYITEC